MDFGFWDRGLVSFVLGVQRLQAEQEGNAGLVRVWYALEGVNLVDSFDLVLDELYEVEGLRNGEVDCGDLGFAFCFQKSGHLGNMSRQALSA